MKLEHMTEIQAKTLGPALEGLDVRLHKQSVPGV